jgi:vacuolar-type H+-ATPase subunit I/STV1
MKYNYSEMSHGKFEELAVQLCFKLLGFGTQGFSAGADGGVDARFNGTANELPSRAAPFEGLTVVQAKHTSDYNRKFSDNDFFGAASSIINKEIPKIKRLIKEDGMSNYMLIANRKLPAPINQKILNYISSETGLEKKNIFLMGVENIETYLKAFPDIPDKVDLNAFDMPLNIEPDELVEVILQIKSQITNINELAKEVPKTAAKHNDKIQRVAFKKKNKINNLGDSYADVIEGKMIAFNEITDFLARPENAASHEKYVECKSELDERIRAIKKPEHEFEYIIEKIYDLIIARDQDCKTNKGLTKLMLHYMYYMCDIGKTKEEECEYAVNA